MTNDDPARFIRSGLYVRATQVTVEQIAQSVQDFLKPFGEAVDPSTQTFSDGAFKNEGLLGVAIHPPVSVASGTWIAVVDSAPRNGSSTKCAGAGSASGR